jgi:hypothetical protein
MSDEKGSPFFFSRFAFAVAFFFFFLSFLFYKNVQDHSTTP